MYSPWGPRVNGDVIQNKHPASQISSGNSYTFLTRNTSLLLDKNILILNSLDFLLLKDILLHLKDTEFAVKLGRYIFSKSLPIWSHGNCEQWKCIFRKKNDGNSISAENPTLRLKSKNTLIKNVSHYIVQLIVILNTNRNNNNKTTR
jgi:hypothetical protein